jgi:PD-(D/E)XK nuclease superfamily
MARVAGNDSYYRFGVIDRSDHVTGQLAHLYSVTTILGVIDKPLTWWAYKLGILATRNAILDPDTNMTPLLMGPDDELYEAIKARKEITPATTRDTAGERGTTIHDVVESFFLHNKLPDPAHVDEQLHPYIKAFVAWTQEFLGEALDTRVVLCERPVYSLEYGYAGTCDLVIFKDGIYYVVDFKTSKALYADTLLQPIAYLHAIEEMSERARRTGKSDIAYLPAGAACQPMVVALHDDETFEPGYAYEHELEFADFMTVYDMFFLKQRLESAGKQLKSRRKKQLRASV